MYQDNVLEATAAAVYAALLRDLPNTPVSVLNKGGAYERVVPARRPAMQEVEVHTWPETWPSTALGYGGMGGAAVTTAQTTVVVSRQLSYACVYWGSGGRLGRSVTSRESIQDLLITRNTASGRR